MKGPARCSKTATLPMYRTCRLAWVSLSCALILPQRPASWGGPEKKPGAKPGEGTKTPWEECYRLDLYLEHAL
jgi:hypothetical protein